MLYAETAHRLPPVVMVPTGLKPVLRLYNLWMRLGFCTLSPAYVHRLMMMFVQCSVVAELVVVVAG